MKKLLFTFFFSVITSFVIGQVVQHKKAKLVYIGAIFGGGYGYLDWNADVEDALKKKKYSAIEIDEIKRLCDVKNHPKYLCSKELFHANRFHFHNFEVREIVSFSSVYAPEGKTLKYKLLWIPFDGNQSQPEGIKPTDKNGFYIIMHRMSVKGKADSKKELKVISKEELDAINAEKSRQAKEKANAEIRSAEQLSKTYTVTYVLQKVSSNMISSAVYYSAVFVEIYDVNDTQSESKMRQRAETELRNNVQLNGYQIHSTFFYKMTASEAKANVSALLELSDSRVYKVEM